MGEAAFDIVFTSYGTIGWLPDLDKWAEIISYYLKPGGLFYIAEFHPVVWMFDEEFTHVKYYYDNMEVIVTENEGTYTDRTADIKVKEYGWNHSISEVTNQTKKNNYLTNLRSKTKSFSLDFGVTFNEKIFPLRTLNSTMVCCGA